MSGNHISTSSLFNATGKTLTITGDTFAHKDAIKALGGRWNATAKSWEIAIPADDNACRKITDLTDTMRDCAFKIGSSKPAAKAPAKSGRWGNPRFGSSGWTCDVCGEQHDANTAVCWECGARR